MHIIMPLLVQCSYKLNKYVICKCVKGFYRSGCVGCASVAQPCFNTVIDLWTMVMLVDRSEWYLEMTNLDVSKEYKFVSSVDWWSEALSQ